ncbi:MAG: ShlB/FhaC/HecB family hemolysin secretion/activation protein [Brevundimonas sp.]|nr:MAG: ShlB/FhaC/HecB family hemolysin secretion/activation protein [Brevundimonas sp.]
MSPFSSAQEITSLDIREYRVEGAKRLPRLEVEEAVYPYLGPGRSPEDVEAARVALEKVYHDKGFQTVSVVVPQQDPRRGIIRLEVVEGKVGRLRVHGARFFLPSRIKAEAPSLAEGNVPDMKQVEKEIVGLNRLGDRRVTPVLRAGVEPGTVDIDLNVEDKNPLHGSIELNNRYSANTTPLRLNGSISHGNLYQLGHTGGLSFQVAPENTDDARVFSGYYLARVSGGVSLMLQATRQDSDVSTLGGASSVGRGHTVGLQAMIDLPSRDSFYQTLSLGLDYKHFAEDIVIGKDTISSPIEYWPLSANYGATWVAEKAFTEMNLSLAFHLRGVGSGETDYGNKRYNADGNFVILRGDVAHTRDLADGSQLFGKVQYQLGNRPLVNNEQIAGGGLGTVRGYLESTALGDNGFFGTFEWRSRSLMGISDSRPGTTPNEWRFHTFADAGLVGIYDPVPGQRKRHGLASAGAGTRFKFKDHFNGSVDVAVPFIGQPDAEAGDVRITFRGWADF